MKLQYCTKCPRWAGKELTCSKCEQATDQKQLPNRRGGIYYIDSVDRQLPSVTSILQKVISKPALTYWISQKVAEYAFAHPDGSMEDAINAPNRVRDTAGRKGQDIHSIIEQHAKGLPINVADHNEPWKAHVEAYVKFMDQIPHQVLETEKMCWSLEYEYAGRLDAIIELGEKIYLVDYKTSKQIYRETTLQLTAYKLALEEQGTKIDALAVVHLKNDGAYAFHEVQPEPKAWLATLQLYNFLYS